MWGRASYTYLYILPVGAGGVTASYGRGGQDFGAAGIVRCGWGIPVAWLRGALWRSFVRRRQDGPAVRFAADCGRQRIRE